MFRLILPPGRHETQRGLDKGTRALTITPEFAQRA